MDRVIPHVLDAPFSHVTSQGKCQAFFFTVITKSIKPDLLYKEVRFILAPWFLKEQGLEPPLVKVFSWQSPKVAWNITQQETRGASDPLHLCGFSPHLCKATGTQSWGP